MKAQETETVYEVLVIQRTPGVMAKAVLVAAVTCEKQQQAQVLSSMIDTDESGQLSADGMNALRCVALVETMIEQALKKNAAAMTVTEALTPSTEGATL